MKAILFGILNASISGGIVIALYLLVRFLLIRSGAKRSLIAGLWLLAALRLAIPFSIVVPIAVVPTVGDSESLSITASSDWTEVSVKMPGAEVISAKESAPGSAVSERNPATSESDPVTSKAASAIDTAGILLSVYLAGVMAMLLYFASSDFRLRLRLRAAVPVSKRVYRADGLDSAFVLGVFRSRIYLPSDLREEYWDHVIRHEEAHIARKDSVRKLIAFLLLTVHWFNPLVWLGYFLFTQDIELACDEAVSKKMDPAERTLYAETLTELCDQRHVTAPSPAAFGEGNAKTRVQALLKSRKTRVAAIVILVVLITAGAALFFGNRIIAANESNSVEDARFPKYYQELKAVIGQPKEVVLKQLNLKEEDLTDHRSGNYKTPITVEYNGLPFRLELVFIYSGENKGKFNSFRYRTYWEDAGDETLQEVRSITGTITENFGKSDHADKNGHLPFDLYTDENWVALFNPKKDTQATAGDEWTLEHWDDPATLETLKVFKKEFVERNENLEALMIDDYMDWRMGYGIIVNKGLSAVVTITFSLNPAYHAYLINGVPVD
ncbi:MAG: M56 family metallopeptidase [Lachnospiraceae bacterium]|nr:M56 family metallopeptidase [Lachnospiraceae bacterium]